MFPLGDRLKPDVRAIARDMDLSIADKGESYEICFVPNGDYAGFLGRLPARQRPPPRSHSRRPRHRRRREAFTEHEGVPSLHRRPAQRSRRRQG